MLALKLAGNTARMNVDSSIDDFLLRGQLFQIHLILNLAMTESNKF